VAEIREVETPEEKVALCRTFLAEHPNHENAARTLSACIYYLGDEQGDRMEALDLAEKTIAAVTDPEVKREMQLEVLGLYGRLGDRESLKRAAEELAAVKSLSYPEHDAVLEAALDAEAWELAAAHAEASLGMASAEAFRADYPERTFTDEEVADAVKRRSAASLAGKGWALAHLGRVDEALAAFEEGSAGVGRNYVGIPDSPLYSYWGRTLAEAGQNEKAMELLAPDAIMGGDMEAMDALHGAYTAMKGEGGFDAYLKEARASLAVEIDDFTLNDYQGEPLSFSQLKGQVVLLSFWFPT
jgi:tetratricopeptide (TPR) repeat protein